MRQPRSKSSRPRFGPVPFFNTKPELHVQGILRRGQIPFRTHARDIPGLPDIVIDSQKAIIFVHGCYWHRHTCRNGRKIPRRNRARWIEVFRRRVIRDRKILRRLSEVGWRVKVVWECHLNSSPLTAQNEIMEFLSVSRESMVATSQPNHTTASWPIKESEMGDNEVTKRSTMPYWVVYILLLLIVLGGGFMAATQAAALDNASIIAKSIADATSKAEEKLAEVQQKVSAASLELDTVNEKLNPLRAEHTSLQTEVTRLQSERAKSVEERIAATTRLGEAQRDYEKLSNQIADAQNSVSLAEERSRAASEKARQEENRLNVTKREVDIVNADLKTKNDRLDALKQDRISKEDALDTVRKHNRDLLSEQVSLQRKVEDAKKLIEDAALVRREIKGLETQKSDLHSEVTGLVLDLNRSQTAFDRQNVKLDSQTALVSELVASERRLRQSVSALEATILDDNQERSRIQSEIDTLRKSRLTDTVEYQKLKLDLEQSNQAALIRQQQVDGLIVQHDRLERDLKTMKTEAVAAKKESDRLDKLLQETRAEFQTVSMDRDRIIQTVREEEQHLLMMRQEKNTLRTGSLLLTDEIKLYTAQRDTLREEVAKLQVDRSTARVDELLTKQMGALSNSLQDLIKKLTDLTKKASEQLPSADTDTGSGDES